MTTKKTLDKIINYHLEKVDEEYKKQLAADIVSVMRFEGIDKLLYRKYTPTFNDGDPCYDTVVFITPPNTLDDIRYVYITGSEVKSFNIEDDDALEMLEDIEQCIPKLHHRTLACIFASNYRMTATSLEPVLFKYKLNRAKSLFERYASMYLGTNIEGILTIQNDSIVLSSQHYSNNY